MINFPSTSL